METRLAEKEDEDGWFVLSGTTGAQFYLVTDFLWVKSTLAGINRDCGDVGTDRDDYEKVLLPITVSFLLTRTVLAVGQFCHLAQCGDCGVELALNF